MTPLKAIKLHCLWCMNSGRLKDVRECGDSDICPLHPLKEGIAVRGMQPLKVIREKCLECAGSSQDVRECPGQMANGFCPLHEFRFGEKPSTKKRRAVYQKRPSKTNGKAIF